jgi:hypothetical protein
MIKILRPISISSAHWSLLYMRWKFNVTAAQDRYTRHWQYRSSSPAIIFLHIPFRLYVWLDSTFLSSVVVGKNQSLKCNERRSRERYTRIYNSILVLYIYFFNFLNVLVLLVNVGLCVLRHSTERMNCMRQLRNYTSFIYYLCDIVKHTNWLN